MFNIVYSKFHLFRGIDRKTSLRANKNIVEGKIKTLSKIEAKNAEAFLLAVNTQFTIPCCNKNVQIS